MVLSGSRTGACRALRWQEGGSRYTCGAIDEPYAVVLSRLPVGLIGLAKPMAAVLPRLARRWIAAGLGCDSSLQPVLLTDAPVGDNPANPASHHLQFARPHD